MGLDWQASNDLLGCVTGWPTFWLHWVLDQWRALWRNQDTSWILMHRSQRVAMTDGKSKSVELDSHGTLAPTCKWHKHFWLHVGHLIRYQMEVLFWSKGDLSLTCCRSTCFRDMDSSAHCVVIDEDNEVVFEEPKSEAGFHTISFEYKGYPNMCSAMPLYAFSQSDMMAPPVEPSDDALATPPSKHGPKAACC